MHTPMVVKHVIVDGSNIATEGREAPSLAQLDEAVRAFVAEYGADIVTVVVDATFPNRIDASERQTYEDAVVANELITPPAGAIGRGDGFVLQIADKAGAAILSNDSFQEFHGNYPWLFERGRLIGGKPVPHVGWVFMERAPVRGPTSRRAVSEARKEAKAAAAASPPAAGGKAPAKAAGKKASTRKSRAKGGAAAEASAPAPETADAPSDAEVPAPAPPSDGAAGDAAGGSAGGPASPPGGSYNDALTFIEFVGAHPVGSEVEATVERFSSHGAYAVVGEARGYVPLRYLADPAPRSAKEVLTVGETRRFVVVAIDPPRRGIDLGLPGVAEATAPPPAAEAAAPEAEAAPARKRGSRKKAAEPQPGEEPPAEEAPVRKRGSRKKAAEPVEAEPEAAPARKRGSRKKAAEPEPAGEPPAEEAPVRKRGSRKKAAEPVEAEAEAAPARKRGSRKKAAEPQPGEESSAAEAPVRKRGSRKKAAAPAEEAAAMNGGPEPASTRKRASRRKAAEGNSAENGSSS
jgi:hypothetical protein